MKSKKIIILVCLIVIILLICFAIHYEYTNQSAEYDTQSIYRINSQKKNVIFIPGLAGCPIYYKNSPIYYKNNDNYKKLWLTYDIIMPKGMTKKTRLFHKYMQVRFENNDFIDKHIETTTWRQNNYTMHDFVLTDDFGGLKGCTNLLPGYNLPLSRIFHDFATIFEKNDIKVYGTSYDFRKITGQNYWQYFSQMLTDLILHAVAENHQKTNLVCHSLGGLLILIFAYQNPEIIQMYVDKIITINSPFDGCSRALDCIVHGFSFKLSTEKASVWFQELLQYYSGILFLAPFNNININNMSHESQKYININNQDYNVNETYALLHSENSEMIQNNILPFRQEYIDAYQYCQDNIQDKLKHIYTTKNETANKFYYNQSDTIENTFASPNSFARHIKRTYEETESGDTLVVESSLIMGPGQTIKYSNNIDHIEILQNKKLIHEIKNMI